MHNIYCLIDKTHLLQSVGTVPFSTIPDGQEQVTASTSSIPNYEERMYRYNKTEGIFYDAGIKTSTEGVTLSQQVIAGEGYHYEPRCLDFFTSRANSLYNYREDGNVIDNGTDYGDAELFFYDSSGVLITYQSAGNEGESEAEYQARLTSGCVKTVLHWTPAYSYSIRGGTLMVKDAPTERAYYWVVAAPHIPAEYGGSVPFIAGGWNLEFFNDKDTVKMDGVTCSNIAVDEVNYSHKIGLICKHAVGAQIGLQMIFEHYRA